MSTYDASKKDREWLILESSKKERKVLFPHCRDVWQPVSCHLSRVRCSTALTVHCLHRQKMEWESRSRCVSVNRCASQWEGVYPCNIPHFVPFNAVGFEFHSSLVEAVTSTVVLVTFAQSSFFLCLNFRLP